MNNNKFGDAFKQGGLFADNIRISTEGDDNELRESMKAYGFIAELAALSDERDKILVGHRRLRIAKELGIEPVIRKLVFGDGDEADAKRLRLAIASNIGFKPMTKEDRQRIAEYLYGEREWTMQRIADALNVSQWTVSNDLSGLEVTSKPSRPKGGRPKSKKKSRQAPKRDDRTDEIIALADQNLTDAEIANRTGVPQRTVRQIINYEMARRKAKAEAPEIDLTSLSMSVQQKCETWKRQTEKRLRIEIAEEERKKIRKEWDEIYLPHYNKTLANAKAIEKAWRGVFTFSDYRRLLAALHPDRSVSSEVLHDLFILFKGKEKVLLSEKERPIVSSPDLPKTYEDWMKRKAEVSAERKAKRAANKAAREGGVQPV